MKIIIGRIAAKVGWAGGIAAAVGFLVLLPFAAVAIARLTGWSWGASLAGLVALNLVPLAGQTVTIGLAVIGAFTLGQDSLAQRQAVPAAASSIEAPSDSAPRRPTDSFAEWKRTIAAPAIQKSCLEDVQRRGLVSGGQVDQMAKACACYGAAAENVITPEEEKDGKLQPSPGFNERLGNEARRLCTRS